MAPAPEDVPGASGESYRSPRDLDGDGNVDTVHTTIDGVNQIEHLDTDGNLTTIELDTDSNGTYESAVHPQADGTVRVATDLDDDGNVDAKASSTRRQRHPGRCDRRRRRPGVLPRHQR